ncbi:MAG TPA: putative glycoside hydrolase [Terriglobales bacterium]|nr:putative glycoside hydrolase [Terriglobales bacterium]
MPSASAVSSPGELHYTVRGSESTTSLARKFLAQSSLMTVAELDQAIRQRNHLKGGLKNGQEVVIPTLEAQPIVEKSRQTPKDADLRAIYFTGNTAGSVYGMELARKWQQAGGNAVVFDIKDSDGTLSIAFDHPLAPKRRPLISNLPKYVRFLHSLNLHAIARIALFRDDNIAQKHSQLAVQSRATGKPWSENGKQVWADSSNPEVQRYNIDLAKFVASSGVDEVQFDYVRFPAEGNQADAKFAFESSPAKLKRSDVIANFLQQAYSELKPTGTLLSVDVFGVMAWQRSVDLAHTGQDIAEMAKHCDVLSPMIYPSHFFGMDGYALPGDAPEHFISTSMQRFHKITVGTGVVIRPWLQAFAWKTKTYSPEYIKVQVLASKQRGGIGFLLWNARNDYVRPLAAMPAMVADANRYFGKADPAAVEREVAAAKKAAPLKPSVHAPAPTSAPKPTVPAAPSL